MVYSSLKKNVLGLICLMIIAVFLLAGLWPFNFCPKNKVRWVHDQNGVEFYGQSHIYSTIPLFQSSTIPVKSFSLELCLQSTPESGSHLGHIFSVLDEQGCEIFFIAQWRSHLLLGKGIRRKKNYREIGIRDVLKRGDKPFVTITSGAEGTNIYVNGILLESSPRFRLFSTNEKRPGRILLGNSPNGKEYWPGNLLSLAFYDRTLTEEEVSQHIHNSKKSGREGLISLYLFDEHSGTLAHDSVGGRHLTIPSRFEVLQKAILVPPWEDFRFTRSYLMDILTNILGFIPFGFFFSAYLRTKKLRSNFRILLTSVIMGGVISLSIELTQVYLPTRSSQLADVITNTLGTIIGVILFSKYHKKLTWNL